MRTIFGAAILAAAFAPPDLLATETAIVEDFPEGTTVLVVENRGGVVTHRIVKSSVRSGSPVTPGPVTPAPPKNELSAFVEQKLQAVPQHKFKEETAIGLAAGYQGLAKAWRDGKVDDVANLQRERKNIHDKLTGALGVSDHWRKYNEAVVAELNSRRPEGDQVPRALDAIAVGLTGGKAINPEIIAAGIQLVMALLSGDSNGVTTAIAKLIQVLIGAIGNGSAYVTAN